MMIKRMLTATALATGLALAGCGTDTDTAGPTTTSSPAADEQSAAFNDADVAFAQQMIPHHQQAVQMAQMAELSAVSPEVRDLAADVQAAQGPEIETMTGWLESWGEDVPSDMTGTEGMDHGGTPMDEMPGMMSAEELAGLESATGVEFDRMWLTMMIDHHEGAVEMARTEQAEGASSEAVALAEKIEADQNAEIELMRGLLGS